MENNKKLKEIEILLIDKINQYKNINLLYNKFSEESRKIQILTPNIFKEMLSYFNIYISNDIFNNFIEKYNITNEGNIDFRSFGIF